MKNTVHLELPENFYYLLDGFFDALLLEYADSYFSELKCTDDDIKFNLEYFRLTLEQLLFQSGFEELIKSFSSQLGIELLYPDYVESSLI